MKTWSFSRLTSYEQCPYSFNLKYIEEREGTSNAWADVGTFVHDILEQVAKGELPKEAVSDYFESLYPYDSVFPNNGNMKGYSDKIFNELLDFFNHFQELDGDIMGIEREFFLDLPNGDKLRGFIDLELVAYDEITKGNETLTCVDYKISNPFKPKDLIKKKRQLYVYAESMKQHWGEYPKEMMFWFVKAQKKLIIPFDEDELKETFDWIMSTIDNIEKDVIFEAKNDFFMCKNLCDFRDTCEYNK
eukprot:GHVU01180631.1.p1 GENE.GHVU01180631.1~~GHVU01180631.1.p1  ORF type:complete len:246 (+),score=36.89 GHVU01180631.1:1056-1793(+)